MFITRDHRLDFPRKYKSYAVELLSDYFSFI